MKSQANNTIYKRIALILSLVALVVWAILGTGASLAWFSDTSPEINNIFHFADFVLEVSHLTENEEWEKVDGQTKIFDDEVLYEPGYVQVVYLKIENKGDRAFEFYTAVNVNDYTEATNVFGQPFVLQNYLKFGVVSSHSEQEMKDSIPDRQTAISIAAMRLHNYDTTTAILQPGEVSYLALIVRMPEEVNNVANYRGDTVPKVELGITVKAEQIHN